MTDKAGACPVAPTYNNRLCWKIKGYLLHHVARVHWKNWPSQGGDPERKKARQARQEYPQLWYCMPKAKRFPWTRAFLQWLCGLTRHELSNTEWGYGGGDYADRWCRWCDKRLRVPKTEIRFQFKETAHMMKKVGGTYADL